MFPTLIAGLLFAAAQNDSDAILISERLPDTHLRPKFARVLAVSDDGNDILFIDDGWISGQRYKRGYIVARFQFSNRYAQNVYLPTSLMLGGGPAEHFRPGAGLWKWDGKDGGLSASETAKPSVRTESGLS